MRGWRGDGDGTDGQTGAGEKISHDDFPPFFLFPGHLSRERRSGVTYLPSINYGYFSFSRSRSCHIASAATLLAPLLMVMRLLCYGD